jgi:hypothetical protein
MKKMLGKR